VSWLYTIVLCVAAFLAGAAVVWLRLTPTIRDLRARLDQPAAQPEPTTDTSTSTATDSAAEAPAAVIPAPAAEPVVEELVVAEPVVAEPVVEEPVAAEPVVLIAEESLEVKANSKSMIFHTPDSPYYKRMKGDVTFRSVAEAERAGYTQWTPKPKVASSAR
jgi:hypothetical protein